MTRERRKVPARDGVVPVSYTHLDVYKRQMQIMVGNVNQVMLSPFGTDPAAAVGNALQILNIITIALSAMGTASTVLILSLIHI